MDENRRRSGQIPAFGDWDYTNDMPITQYFECPRQAGLIRHSSSSGDTDPCVGGGDLYAVHFKKPSRTTVLSPPRKKREKERRYDPHVKEQKRVGKVCDVTEPARKPGRQLLHHTNHAVPPPLRVISADVRPPKPVDEDLYKIPPELHTTKQKKRLGFFSRCLEPACAA
ncbi:hypothetical protein F2P56_024448 [Juglans regia]|uniref:RPM1-interacting protein 4-like n=2 Tax=Juglans regia TaxID=51240 RepID=A0A833X2Q6_JUGRE|nr:uncharacterized protein LOC108995762 [Juglans regia]KAF5454811.1 hypothetical protein F2P56_024448 [Juglans regia]